MGHLTDLEISKYKRESKVCMPIKIYHFIFFNCCLIWLCVKKILKKTLLQMKMYYVREYTPGCRFFKPTISLEMPVPSQGHYGFHSFPAVD